MSRRLRTAREILLFVTVAIFPLLIAPGLMLDEYNAPKLTALLVVAPLALAMRSLEAAMTPGTSKQLPMAVPALLILVPLTISWPMSPYRGWALMGLYTRYQGLIPYVAVALLGMLVAEAFGRRVHLLAWAIAMGGAGVGAYATYQMLFLGADIGSFSTSSFVVSTLGHSNFAGGFLAIALPPAVALWSHGGRLKWAAMAATVAIADGLLFSFSQGAWLAGAAGVLVVLGLGWRHRHKLLSTIALGLAASAGLLSIGLVGLANVSSELAARYPDLLETVRIRGFLWQAGLEMFAERPVFGWGPNAYAWEGVRHRVLEEGLYGGSTFVGNDPHSVPIAFATSAGMLGLAGFIGVFVWAFSRWKKGSTHPLAPAFAGGVVAYLVQALASLDELALRVALWTCLAGLWGVSSGMSATPAMEPMPLRTRAFGSLRSTGNIVIAVIAAACAAYASIYVGVADAFARKGAVALSRDEVDAGRRWWDRAISIRKDPYFARTYAELLGHAAIEREERGADLIEESGRLLRALDEAGDPTAAAIHARLLHGWSVFDPKSDIQALARFRRARTIDPRNPDLAVGESDVLVALGRYQEAIDTLEPIARLLVERFPQHRFSRSNKEIWGALAIAYAEAGELESAKKTLEIVDQADIQECRALIARELLKPDAQQTRPLALNFVCPRVLIELLPDDA